MTEQTNDQPRPEPRLQEHDFEAERRQREEQQKREAILAEQVLRVLANAGLFVLLLWIASACATVPAPTENPTPPIPFVISDPASPLDSSKCFAHPLDATTGIACCPIPSISGLWACRTFEKSPEPKKSRIAF